MLEVVRIPNSIEYYEENEKCPVLEFLQSLTSKEQAKILKEIDLLEKFGFSLGMPYIKKLEGTEELWELRIKQSSNIYRIFYFHFMNGQFVLLHGIKKQSSKTQKRDIALAERRISKYKKGKENL